MTVRYYSSVATPKTLSVTINAGATSVTLSDGIGLPLTFPFTLALNYGDVNEELVDVTGGSTPTYTITRAVDGTSATSHTAGSTVRHVSSARDFADSRTHENSSNGVHGLSPTEDLVGTDSAQTLSNKTFINATGSFLDIDINNSTGHVIDITKTPAGVDTNTMFRTVNGSDETMNVANNGRIRIQNPPSYDALNTNRRFQVTLSNGTTEVFYINTSGMCVSQPRLGALSSQAGFKVIVPDAIDRAAFLLRDPTDTNDRFNVHAAGHVDINGSDPAVSQLDVRGAVAQSASFMRVQDSGGTNMWSVNSNGLMVANRRASIQNGFDTTAVVLSVEGFSPGQTGDLQRWLDGTGATAARVRSDGSADFTAQTATSGVFTVAAGWTLTSQAAAVKAGVVTINIILTRTGGTITSSSTGNIADESLGTVDATYRPNSVFGANSLASTGTTGIGDGATRLTANTGAVTLVSWSSTGSISNGDGLQFTYTYAT